MTETLARQTKDVIGVTVRYRAECYRKDGTLRWADGFENLVVTEGRNALLDNTFVDAADAVAWYVGLKGAGTVAAADVMNSHAGWTEVTAYDEADRPAWTPNGAAASGAVSNSSSRASYAINDTATIAGAFLASDDTKGGTAGALFGAGDFASPRAMESGDTLLVRVDVSVTSS